MLLLSSRPSAHERTSCQIRLRARVLVGRDLCSRYSTGPRGLATLFEKERQILAAEQRNADLAKDIERAQQRIDRLGDDRTEQERIVEERLNLVHPGDKVFMLPDSKRK